MKICFFNVRTSDMMSMPLGITYLGSVLRENGHEVRLFDLYPMDDIKLIIDDLAENFPPDFVGYSMMTTNFNKTKELNTALKKQFPDKIYCAGGIHPTVLPQETIDDLSLDFVLIGEGENTILKVIDAIENHKNFDGIKGIAYKQEGGGYYISKELNVVQDLDTLPLPARDLLPVERYLVPPGYIRSVFLNRVMSVITSRGCPYTCTFCNSNKIFYRKTRRRSAENVLNEVENLIKDYKIDGIYFHDETFPMFNNEWLKTLCAGLERLGIKWGCQTTVNVINSCRKENIEMVKKSGCVQVDVGMETASDRMLKKIQKAHTREEAIKAFKFLNDNNIRSFTSFIIGLPDENEEDLKANLSFLDEIKPNFTYFNLLTPYPGTVIANTAIKEGKLDKKYFYKDYDMLIETEPLVNLSNVTTDTLKKYHQKLRNKVFVKNYLSMLTINNLRFLLKAIFSFFLTPSLVIKSIKDLYKTRNIEVFVFAIFTSYQRWESRKFNKFLISKKRSYEKLKQVI